MAGTEPWSFAAATCWELLRKSWRSFCPHAGCWAILTAVGLSWVCVTGSCVWVPTGDRQSVAISPRSDWQRPGSRSGPSRTTWHSYVTGEWLRLWLPEPAGMGELRTQPGLAGEGMHCPRTVLWAAVGPGDCVLISYLVSHSKVTMSPVGWRWRSPQAVSPQTCLGQIQRQGCSPRQSRAEYGPGSGAMCRAR